jgi:hypothetical protein
VRKSAAKVAAVQVQPEAKSAPGRKTTDGRASSTGERQSAKPAHTAAVKADKSAKGEKTVFCVFLGQLTATAQPTSAPSTRTKTASAPALRGTNIAATKTASSEFAQRPAWQTQAFNR